MLRTNKNKTKTLNKKSQFVVKKLVIKKKKLWSYKPFFDIRPWSYEPDFTVNS